MALRVPLFCPKLQRITFKFRSNHSSFSATPFNIKGNSQISCTKNISDAEIAADLAAEMARIKTPLVQRKEAMSKSRELLFGEFCQYLGLRPEEVKQRWRKMDEVDKMGVVKGFVSEWSLDFHPLSSRSVKEMVEEHLKEENPFVASSPSLLFPIFKKMLGFSQDNQNGKSWPCWFVLSRTSSVHPHISISDFGGRSQILSQVLMLEVPTSSH